MFFQLGVGAPLYKNFIYLSGRARSTPESTAENTNFSPKATCKKRICPLIVYIHSIAAERINQLNAACCLPLFI